MVKFQKLEKLKKTKSKFEEKKCGNIEETNQKFKKNWKIEKKFTKIC